MAKQRKKVAPSKGADADPTISPQERLVQLANAVTALVKVAKKHRCSLRGVNHYANKLATMRADAANAFEALSSGSVGDTSTLAELVDQVFSADTDYSLRIQSVRDLQFSLKTTWKDAASTSSHLEVNGVFPLTILTSTGRGYLTSVGRQLNGAYLSGWYDACAVMMRRLLESSIIEAFEARKLVASIKDANGDFLQLTAMIGAALAESTWNLPRNVRKDLGELRDLGHRSAHNRYYLAKKGDIDRVIGVYRESVEAFLHIAGLVK